MIFAQALYYHKTLLHSKSVVTYFFCPPVIRMTPIMWNIDTIGISGTIKTIFKLNPMYYIVQGYRDTLINGVWFWQRPELTLYFWIFTVGVFVLGRVVFKRLKPHFADIL